MPTSRHMLYCHPLFNRNQGALQQNKAPLLSSHPPLSLLALTSAFLPSRPLSYPPTFLQDPSFLLPPFLSSFSSSPSPPLKHPHPCPCLLPYRLLGWLVSNSSSFAFLKNGSVALRSATEHPSATGQSGAVATLIYED